MEHINKLEELETALIGRFVRHPVLGHLEELSNYKFEEVLLQKRIFSMDFFERFYNSAICGLESEEAKEIARGLIREEYPKSGPNHREDAVYDLLKIGLSKGRILGSVPTRETETAINNLIGIVAYKPTESGKDKSYDLRAIVAMRFGGEVLAGEEMALLWKQLQQRYGLIEADSKFYLFHAMHDKKYVEAGKLGPSHSDRFGKVLKNAVNSDANLELAVKVMNDCYLARAGFYEQFRRG